MEARPLLMMKMKIVVRRRKEREILITRSLSSDTMESALDKELSIVESKSLSTIRKLQTLPSSITSLTSSSRIRELDKVHLLRLVISEEQELTVLRVRLRTFQAARSHSLKTTKT